MTELDKKPLSTISERWQLQGNVYYLNRLREQGVDPDSILSGRALFLTSDLLVLLQKVSTEDYEEAKRRYSAGDYRLRESKAKLDKQLDDIRRSVVQNEARRLQQAFGYTESEALALAKENTAGIELDPNYVAVNPDKILL